MHAGSCQGSQQRLGDDLLTMSTCPHGRLVLLSPRTGSWLIHFFDYYGKEGTDTELVKKAH